MGFILCFAGDILLIFFLTGVNLFILCFIGVMLFIWIVYSLCCSLSLLFCLFGLCIRCAVDSYCYLTFNANFIHHFRQYVWFIHQVTSTMIHGIIPVSFQLKCYFVYFMFYWCYFVYLFLIVYLYCVFVMLLTLIVI